MKQFLLLLFIATALTANSQKTDLVTVNSVKPKKGQKMAFEAAYKQHVAKFHKTDEKISVYEIMSGPNIGFYHLVNSGRSYSDFDKERPDASAHNLDLDKTFFPLLDETVNGTFRFMDSLSLRPEVTAEAFVVTVRHLKGGLNMDDYRRELGRAVRLNKLAKGAFIESLSVSFFEQLWDGSEQVTVSIRNLKDGFKSLEQGYYAANPPGSTSFRETYEKAYGGTAWDDRIKLLEDAVTKTEVYIARLRKDLSSQ
ncbi:MAG TPA: hypothetical protein VJ765_06140 [Chitinophagaceae bacterium]|nr:hypothetical protein [Chitinophagaceae bacterium]